MLSFVKNMNIFDPKFEFNCLVNTVNMVGVMGKGIALEFKKRYPNYYEDYKTKCRRWHINVGTCDLWISKEMAIISFPTKGHWAYPSKLIWIDRGLEDLRRIIDKNPLLEIGMPALGCSNGGLNWEDVKPLIIKHLEGINNRVVVFEPQERKDD